VTSGVSHAVIATALALLVAIPTTIPAQQSKPGFAGQWAWIAM
jgi:hypothetical protein